MNKTTLLNLLLQSAKAGESFYLDIVDRKVGQYAKNLGVSVKTERCMVTTLRSKQTNETTKITIL